MTADELWAGLAHDPRDPQFAGLRASDQDREVVRALLAIAYADGRLDRTEFDERSDAVTAARTLGDLPPILSDLVAPAPARPAGLAQVGSADLAARARRKYESDRREAVAAFLLASTISLVIWSVVMFGGFFWPTFVIAGTGVNLAQTLMRRQEIIDRHLARLEAKQAKQLERQRRREIESPPDEDDA
ncbi:DUF1707 domain-containing protein [Nocardioides sp. cx-169]|uniref:DUF1707 SHOCT-like domain-containing protein n=1 Tax=Nocardioides sp. cx-169 TaxID=2899080 RepID=UPI001E2ABFC4|nr:DUF1707 domain-containing protein [Nocardioides sp. cx-169]MCD4534951.1 DUF1707 domain-containing protein [Nocardioides sp. cx-169]